MQAEDKKYTIRLVYGNGHTIDLSYAPTNVSPDIIEHKNIHFIFYRNIFDKNIVTLIYKEALIHSLV